jgi:carbamoyltransferase
MITWGINALNHDASIAVFDGVDLVDHRLSSEFSGIKSDFYLDKKLLAHCHNIGKPEMIFWYERPWLKKARQLRAGQWKAAFDIKDIPKLYLRTLHIKSPIFYTDHHHSHAAAGYYTSPFNNAAVVVIDAIGEWETCTIWHGNDDKLTKVWSRSYPTSIGLFYSAFTDLIGLTAVKDEFKLQELSKKGDPDMYYQDVREYFDNTLNLKFNLHKGVYNWPYTFNMTEQDKADIAASVQKVFEEQVDKIMTLAQTITGSHNLVYMGGCAYNSLYNEYLVNKWNKVWSIRYPGDPGSALGAFLAHSQTKIKYDYPVKHITIKL